MTLQQRLKELRSRQGLTLKELGMRSELSVSYLSDIERGRSTPTLSTLETLATALSVSVMDLLTGVDFGGATKTTEVPVGLSELCSDPEYGAEITQEWLELLAGIGAAWGRPVSKRDWLELYLHLERILK